MGSSTFGVRVGFCALAAARIFNVRVNFPDSAPTGTLSEHQPDYLLPMTIECGPTSGTTRAVAKPASRIQPMQSAPV